MRLLVNARYRVFATGFTAALAGCGAIIGGNHAAPTQGTLLAATGPAADYPMVLGDPFTVDGEVFTPADSLNYDAVGFAAIDEGAGVTAAHRTLPLPSYAEVTSLENGKTTLVRVERRGPMTGNDLVSLSAAAAAQLGAGASLAVRVRRVNPPEAERAELRAGRSVAERMETPKSLVEVLRRKLPAAGAATLSAPAGQGVQLATVQPVPGRQTTSASVAQSVDTVAEEPRALAAVPAVAETGSSATAAPSVGSSEPKAASVSRGRFAVQAGAFANKANAARAAVTLGGFVSPSGRLFLVRTGPFATRANADAALAKVRAAGYSDARVITPG